MGKSLARKSDTAIALECLRSPEIRVQLLKKLGVILRKELKVMCSEKVNSVLRHTPSSSFSWDSLKSELCQYAPTLLSIMIECTKTVVPCSNRDAVVGFCCSILVKYRYARMCAVQKMLSIVLYGGHASKQVILSIHTRQFRLYTYSHTVLFIHYCLIHIIGV